MWVVVVGGVFGILTLLVKAVVDLGSKTNRERAAITADVELLKALPDELHSARLLLRKRIERHVIAYTAVPVADDRTKTGGQGSDGSTPPAGADEARRLASGVAWRAIVMFTALSVVIVASSGVAVVSDLVPSDLDWVTSDAIATAAGGIAVLIGTTVPLLFGRAVDRHREAVDEAELERQAAELAETLQSISVDSDR